MEREGKGGGRSSRVFQSSVCCFSNSLSSNVEHLLVPAPLNGRTLVCCVFSRETWMEDGSPSWFGSR